MDSNFKGIDISDCDATEIVYTFVDGNTGEPTHIAVSALTRAIQRAGIIPMVASMGEGLIAAIERGDLNQEPDHAARLPSEALEAPCIVGAWGGEHIIIDGTHRLWRRYQRGDRDFPAYYIPEDAWRHFVIHGMPGDGEFWDHFNRNVQVRG
jgi:hypothetical protein